MRLPIVDGRECVPVRLLPYLTAWRPLSPDVVAQLFSLQHPWHRWSLTSQYLSTGGTHPGLPASQWDNVFARLIALELELREEGEGEPQYVKWLRLGVESLPAGVFVWRDELEVEYGRTFGRVKFVMSRPGLTEFTDEECEEDLDRLVSLCANSGTSEAEDEALERHLKKRELDTQTRVGDGELNFHPLLSLDDEKLAFEGFESVMPGGRQLATPKARECSSCAALDEPAVPGLTALPTKSGRATEGVASMRVAEASSGHSSGEMVTGLAVPVIHNKPVACGWKTLARAEARKMIARHQSAGLFLPQLRVAELIADDFRNRKPPIHGGDGKPLSGATIKRHALKGISSATKKSRSTATSRGK